MSDPISGIVRDTFDCLNESGANYVVLRGYLPIDQLCDSADIDVLVTSPELSMIQSALAPLGWRSRKLQVGRYPHFFIDHWGFPDRLITSLDFVTGLFFGDELLELPNARVVFSTAISSNGISVPDPWIGALLFLLHVAFDKQHLSDANRDRGREFWAECSGSPGGRSLVSASWGANASDLVDSFYSKINEISDVELAGLRETARRIPGFRAHRATQIIGYMKHFFRARRNRALRVAILGPDGSGKSTLVDYVLQHAGAASINAAYLGSNQYRTWPARRLAHYLDDARSADRTHGLSYRLASNLFGLWWTVEQLARMVIAEHERTIVMYDRFPLAEEFDSPTPTTLVGRLMRGYRQLTRYLLPKPDLIVLLDGDPALVWSRKKEHSFETHVRLRNWYISLISGASTESLVIRSDSPIHETFSSLQAGIGSSEAVRRMLY